jgi:hypothetical protein
MKRAKLVREEVQATTVMLGVNSQAAIQATRNTKGNPGHYLVNALHNQTEAAQMHHKQLDLEAQWVPGHKGTPGNERADEEAKKAAKGNSSPDTSLPTQCRGHLPLSKAATCQAFNKNLKAEVAVTFAKSPRYQRMQEINPSIPSLQFMKIVSLLTQRAASLLIQLRTGHIPLNKHLHRIGRSESQLCSMCPGQDKTIHHYIMACPAYAQERKKLEKQLGQFTCSLKTLLLNPKAIPHLFEFVHASQWLTTTFGDVATPDKN